MKIRVKAYQKTNCAAVAPGVGLARRTQSRYGIRSRFFNPS
jgi:hypothetical protein